MIGEDYQRRNILMWIRDKIFADELKLKKYQKIMSKLVRFLTNNDGEKTLKIFLSFCFNILLKRYQAWSA